MAEFEWFDPLTAFSDVTSFSEHWEPYRGKAHELAQATEVLTRLTEYAHVVGQYVRSCPGLKVASTFELPRIKTVAKNLAWLTSVSLLKLPTLRFTVDADDPEETCELRRKRSLFEEAVKPWLELHRERVLIPIPTQIVEYDGRQDVVVSDVDLSDSVLDASFSNSLLARQMSEVSLADMPGGVLELLLPRLALLPLSEILEVRRDAGPSFMRFQNELVSVLRQSATSDSEIKLLDLLRHIDNEVNRLRREFEALDQRKRLQALGLTYSFGVLSLVLVLPSEIFKSLAALLGSSSVFRTLENIRLIKLEQRELEDDPFYIPYRLTTLVNQH